LIAFLPSTAPRTTKQLYNKASHKIPASSLPAVGRKLNQWRTHKHTELISLTQIFIHHEEYSHNEAHLVKHARRDHHTVFTYLARIIDREQLVQKAQTTRSTFLFDSTHFESSAQIVLRARFLYQTHFSHL
jgi:hypothetical protein